MLKFHNILDNASISEIAKSTSLNFIILNERVIIKINILFRNKIQMIQAKVMNNVIWID